MTQHNQFDHDFVEDSNTSKNPEFSQIVAKRMSRRTMLKGGTGLTAAAFVPESDAGWTCPKGWHWTKNLFTIKKYARISDIID